MSVDCFSIENVYCNLIGWFFLIFSNVGWRLGLQQITGLLITTFLLGTFYRSASLYHPQRRAILHLKTQKRKIKNKDKEKNKLQDDRPPFFEFTALKSRTVQIILLSTFLSHMGIFSPLFFLVSINSMCVDNIRVSRFTFSFDFHCRETDSRLFAMSIMPFWLWDSDTKINDVQTKLSNAWY